MELIRLAVGMAALLFLFPLFPLLLMSVSGPWRWPDLLPSEWTIRAWAYVFSSHSGTVQAISYSLAIAFSVTALNLLLCLPAANALARMEFRGKRWVTVLLYSPVVIPPFAAVMGIHFTFIRLGLTETVLGVVLSHLPATLPYVLRALTTSYRTLGQEWEHQAQLLGAGAAWRFWHIALPHLRPGIAVGCTLSLLISFSQYLITFLIGGGQVMTLPLLLFPFLNGGDMGIAAAYTLLFAGMALFALILMDWLLKQHYRLL